MSTQCSRFTKLMSIFDLGRTKWGSMFNIAYTQIDTIDPTGRAESIPHGFDMFIPPLLHNLKCLGPNP